MKIECLICGNTWTKHEFEDELVYAFGGELIPDASDGWCPSCGEMGEAYEVGSNQWRASKAYHDSVRESARAEYVAAGKPNKSYREYHEEVLRHGSRD